MQKFDVQNITSELVNNFFEDPRLCIYKSNADPWTEWKVRKG